MPTKRARFADLHHVELLDREAILGAQFRQPMRRLVHWFVGEGLERSPVDANCLRRAQILADLHSFRHIDVHHLHEPARRVGPDGDEGHVERPQPPADVLEVLRVAGVARMDEAQPSPSTTQPPQSDWLASVSVRFLQCCSGTSVIFSVPSNVDCHQSSSSTLVMPFSLSHALSPSGTTRFGPAKETGQAYSEKIGSKSTFSLPSRTSTEAWPIHVIEGLLAGARSAAGSAFIAGKFQPPGGG